MNLKFYSVCLTWHISLFYFDAKLQKNEVESKYFRIFAPVFLNIESFMKLDKASGTTRMVESVPALNVEEETGTINLFDYIDKNE